MSSLNHVSKKFYKIKKYDERFLPQDYDLTHKFIQDSRYSIGKINKYLYNLRDTKDSISKI